MFHLCLQHWLRISCSVGPISWQDTPYPYLTLHPPFHNKTLPIPIRHFIPHFMTRHSLPLSDTSSPHFVTRHSLSLSDTSSPISWQDTPYPYPTLHPPFHEKTLPIPIWHFIPHFMKRHSLSLSDTSSPISWQDTPYPYPTLHPPISWQDTLYPYLTLHPTHQRPVNRCCFIQIHLIKLTSNTGTHFKLWQPQSTVHFLPHGVHLLNCSTMGQDGAAPYAHR
jgi:hypothetical protein